MSSDQRGRRRPASEPAPGTRDEYEDQATLLDDIGPPARIDKTVQSFTLTRVAGPDPGATHEITGGGCAIGSHPLNDVVLEDGTVSRFHCEIRVEDHEVVIRDLGSKNRTIVDGLAVREALVRGGSLIRLGRSELRFALEAGIQPLALSDKTRFGSLVGSSTPMRSVFTMLERVAGSEITVLLEGETGTGKGKAAEAIHAASSRSDGPFIVVDCGAIPENLLESELFGHEKGAFTGAESRRIGAFEEASGGTIFLDEIGEVSLSIQPKLLRALENLEIRRLGSNRFMPVDVRVIAATNRDLRTEVNRGDFRPDLYYRLAVAMIRMPPLRERREDIAEIAREMLRTFRVGDDVEAEILGALRMPPLSASRWPGNVRELRNYVERSLLFPETDPTRGPPAAASAETPDELPPFSVARKQAIAGFEREYLTTLLSRFEGKVSDAAQAAGVDRVYLYRLLRRNNLKPSGK